MYKLSDTDLLELKHEAEDNLCLHYLVVQILEETKSELEKRSSLYL